MVALLKQHYSVEQYLTLERESDQKHEYVDGEIFAMAGASPNHDRITRNAIISLDTQTQDKSCEVFTSDIRVRVSSTRYLYPDVKITCEPQLFDNDHPPSLLNPVVIIEVASASTQKYDKTEKFSNFRRIASLKEYLIIEQTEIHVEHWIRQDDIHWQVTDIYDRESIIVLSSINCTLLVSDLYRGVILDREV